MIIRDQSKGVQVNLRIRESLRRRLAAAAHRNGTSLNNEMRVRLERSLEVESLRSVNDVAQDLEICWLRYGDRFVARELEEDILAALEARDFDKARALAIVLRKTQENAARMRTQKMVGDGE
jgi:hypothetical protein